MPSQHSYFSFLNTKEQAPYIIKIFVMAAVYFVTGALSLAITSDNHIITIIIFAAEGFALAAVLLSGPSIIPGIFLGQLLLALSQSTPVLASFFIASVNSLEAFLAWQIVHHSNLDISLSRTKDLFGLFGLIALVFQPFSAFFGVLALYSTGVLESAEYLRSLFSWWFGNTLGQMLWTPLLLLFYYRRKRLQLTELLLSTSLFAFIAYALFFLLPLNHLSIITAVTLPLITYVSIAKGRVFASAMLVTLALVAMYNAYLLEDSFSRMSIIDYLINPNFFILSHILIVWGVGTLYAEIKEARERLSHLNSSLEEEVQQQIDETKRKNELIVQQAKLASIGEMLGMIAHQWRQPLNRINSNIAVLNSVIEEKDFDNPLLKKKLENIKTQTRFMSDTIEDFSSFFRPDKKATLFYPCKVVQKALTLIDINNKQISTHFQGDTDIKVLSYENEYLQVILSILHNAIENFAVTHTADPLLDIKLVEDDTHIILSIQDSGGGIRHEKIETIFDPFVTTNQSEKNSGLGLYMARLLVEESMRGTLDVANRNGGACFTITLPKEDSYA